MRKNITVKQGFMEGYGGPGQYWARIICDNVLLESFQSRSEGDIAVKVHEAKKKWSREWTKERWSAAIAGKTQASALCSVCGGDTVDGVSSCVEMTFCKKCEPRIDEFRKKYQEKVEARQRAAEVKRQDESKKRTAATRSALADGCFHWRDGWYFKRMQDGSVRVMRLAKMVDGEEYIQTNLTIPPNEWASIVCSVSAGGEGDGRWDAAQDFHGLTAQP